MKAISLPIIDMHMPDHSQAGSFEYRADVIAPDIEHRRVLRKATGNYAIAVDIAKQRFLNHEDARLRAGRIKRDAIEHLDRYLEEFETNLLRNGGKIHWAKDAEEARTIILDIATKAGISHVVKSKSMATEEVHLNDALIAAGIEPVETDLGEFICQIRHEPPYHFVTPCMHLTKEQISETFHDTLGLPRTDSAQELTFQARQLLRQKFVTAVMGITGANFLVADVGMIAITENEGNARLSFSAPHIHVALVGIEKILPRMQDLGLFWPLLSTSGTGQHLTCYSSLIGGPRKPGELDGPREFHVVLMDNGRSKLLADPEQREAAQCIRCGACLNMCPVFKGVGGHTYGTTYQGPIGSVITPHLKELYDWKHLSYASSLCGRCTEVCPVKIDVHHHLLRNRRDAVQQGYSGFFERTGFRVWLWSMRSPARYGVFAKLGRMGLALVRTLRLNKIGRKNPAAAWSETRALPVLPDHTFRDWWRERNKVKTQK